MEPYRVFISSIMNKALEDLAAERAAARAAIQQFGPITVPWDFEVEPASPKPLLDFYIDAVKTSDLFILIIGEHVTKPVQDEFQAACDYGKARLVFCKQLPVRQPDTDALLKSLNAKYDVFINAVELQEKVRQSLGNHLLNLVRGESSTTDHLGDRIARLRQFARTQKLVSILPTVPRCIHNSFTVEKVEANSVTFLKNAIAFVTVPIGRIEEILDKAPHEPPTIHLNGRLQFITALQNWRFFPEKPPPTDPLCIGLARQVLHDLALSQETLSRLQGMGLTHSWSNPENVPEREVFFDEDGRHLTNGRQILTYRRL